VPSTATLDVGGTRNRCQASSCATSATRTASTPAARGPSCPAAARLSDGTAIAATSGSSASGTPSGIFSSAKSGPDEASASSTPSSAGTATSEPLTSSSATEAAALDRSTRRRCSSAATASAPVPANSTNPSRNVHSGYTPRRLVPEPGRHIGDRPRTDRGVTRRPGCPFGYRERPLRPSQTQVESVSVTIA
jgi:hypothetical protein